MTELLEAAIRIATPLTLAAIGGVLSERAGVFAAGLEGMMLAGAFGAALGSWATLSFIAGTVAAACCGAAVGILVAVVSVRFRADQMVTGLAANMVVLGLTSSAFRLAGEGGRPPVIHLKLLEVWSVPGIGALPVVGPLVFAQPPLTWLAALCCVAVWLLLWRTRWGLALRVMGEKPEAGRSAGFSPLATRFAAVVGCGALAGMGGAVLVLQQTGTFTDGMTAGRGYLAMAALVIGRWMPGGVLIACLAFGAAEALSVQLRMLALPLSSHLLQMTPYLLCLLVLAATGRGARMPAAIGGRLDRSSGA